MRALPLSCSLFLDCFFLIAPLLCPSSTGATGSHSRYRQASSRCNRHVKVPLAGSQSLTLTSQVSRDCKPAKDTIVCM
uniref:Putative secreted protein n=1 Tax=Ixodes ricinus TaxID=34613 RepID=A0A6B0TWZ1_IXORI